jgi:hypothetical protein
MQRSGLICLLASVAATSALAAALWVSNSKQVGSRGSKAAAYICNTSLPAGILTLLSSWQLPHMCTWLAITVLPAVSGSEPVILGNAWLPTG